MVPIKREQAGRTLTVKSSMGARDETITGRRPVERRDESRNEGKRLGNPNLRCSHSH